MALRACMLCTPRQVPRALNEVAVPLFELPHGVKQPHGQDARAASVSVQCQWAIADGYGMTIGRPDGFGAQDFVHPKMTVLAPLNAQFLEHVFDQLCPETLAELRAREDQDAMM